MPKLSRNTQVAVLILLSLLIFTLEISAVGAAVYAFFPRKISQKSAEQTKAPPASPAADLNPLQIEAIKARTYPGSTLTIEQNLGNQGSYMSQVVSYQSDDLKIYTLMATPHGSVPTGGWPVIILNHGYINPSVYRTNDGSYGGIIQALTQAGFVVLKPDYRGHGQSQGTADGGHFSPVYTYDDMNLIATIKQTTGLNATRIGTLGHSLGAHTSLRVAVVSPDVKATVYLSGVVASIYDILYNWPHSPMPGDLPAKVQTTREQLLAQYGTPRTNPSFWDSVSAINYVGNITGKSQINVSENDSVVPSSFSANLNTALVEANKPVEYYVYPGDDHQFSANSVLAYKRIVTFFTTSL